MTPSNPPMYTPYVAAVRHLDPKVKVSTKEYITAVFLNVITLGIYNWVQNCALQKGLYSGNIEEAKIAIRRGACCWLSNKQFIHLVENNNTESLKFIFGQMNSQTDTTWFHQDSNIDIFGNHAFSSIEKGLLSATDSAQRNKLLKVYLDYRPVFDKKATQESNLYNKNIRILFDQALRHKDLECVKILADSHTFDPNGIVDNIGFHSAFHDLSVENLTYWIEIAGMDPNRVDRHDWRHTLLAHAIKEEKIDVMRYLLEHGASITKTRTNSFHNIRYATPLLAAVDKKNIEMVQLLLKYGASPTQKELTQTPLSLALDSLNKEMIQAFIDSGRLDEDSLKKAEDHIKWLEARPE